MPAKITFEEFVKRSNIKHNFLYTYDIDTYINTKTKTKIIHPTLGEFWQEPTSHMNGCGHPILRKNAPKDISYFIEKSKSLYPDIYDYSQVVYKNITTAVVIIDIETGIEYSQRPDKHLMGQKPQPLMTVANMQKLLNYKLKNNNYIILSKSISTMSEKIEVGCEIHGSFLMSMTDLLLGHGCNMCGIIKSQKARNEMGKKNFFINSKINHVDENGIPKYDYSKSVYVDVYTPITVICRIHGEFKVPPVRHNGSDKQGCPECSKISYANKRGIDKNDFIYRSTQKYGNGKFNYDKIPTIVNTDSVMNFVCMKHNYEFEQVGVIHLSPKTKHSCPKCASESRGIIRTHDNERFISQANKIHKNMFTYDNVIYKNNHTKVSITCHEHGDFLMIPNSHLSGRGCPKCKTNEAKCISRDIDNFFDEFESEKKFKDCVYKRKLPFDRYIPNINTLLEYDGIQHFSFKSCWHKNINEFNKAQTRDTIKTEYAIKNGYNFIRIAYYEDHIDVLKSFLKLIEDNPGKQIVQIYGEVQII